VLCGVDRNAMSLMCVCSSYFFALFCVAVSLQVMRSQAKWMLCHPEGTVQDLSEHLKTVHSEYL
jgi:hypothetical protein